MGAAHAKKSTPKDTVDNLLNSLQDEMNWRQLALDHQATLGLSRRSAEAEAGAEAGAGAGAGAEEPRARKGPAPLEFEAMEGEAVDLARQFVTIHAIHCSLSKLAQHNYQLKALIDARKKQAAKVKSAHPLAAYSFQHRAGDLQKILFESLKDYDRVTAAMQWLEATYDVNFQLFQLDFAQDHKIHDPRTGDLVLPTHVSERFQKLIARREELELSALSVSFNYLDLDQSGHIEAAEMPELPVKIFSLCDVNHNHKISKKELLSVVQKHQSQIRTLDGKLQDVAGPIAALESEISKIEKQVEHYTHFAGGRYSNKDLVDQLRLDLENARAKLLDLQDAREALETEQGELRETLESLISYFQRGMRDHLLPRTQGFGDRESVEFFNHIAKTAMEASKIPMDMDDFIASSKLSMEQETSAGKEAAAATTAAGTVPAAARTGVGASTRAAGAAAAVGACPKCPDRDCTCEAHPCSCSPGHCTCPEKEAAAAAAPAPHAAKAAGAGTAAMAAAAVTEAAAATGAMAAGAGAGAEAGAGMGAAGASAEGEAGVEAGAGASALAAKIAAAADDIAEQAEGVAGHASTAKND